MNKILPAIHIAAATPSAVKKLKKRKLSPPTRPKITIDNEAIINNLIILHRLHPPPRSPEFLLNVIIKKPFTNYIA